MKTKKLIAGLAAAAALQLCGCSGENISSEETESVIASVSETAAETAAGVSENTGVGTENDRETVMSAEKTDNTVHISAEVKGSPDKYTWYIKDYVGKNCASLGYCSLSGKRVDKYGSGYLSLVFVSPEHSYIDVSDEDMLSEYVVTGQNLEPNTELKLTFLTDENGEEYNNLVDVQSYDEIVLSVKKVGEKDGGDMPLTAIKPSPDKYTRYMADYTGRNAANCGYTSMLGNRIAEYGQGNIKLNILSADGSFIDIKDEEALKDYYVVSQSPSPDTEIKFRFMKDESGKEYAALVETQSIEEADLYVTRIGNTPTEAPSETAVSGTAGGELKGIRPEFKEAMDSYEDFFDDYCDIMKQYMENPFDMSLLAKYSEYMTKAEEMNEKMDILGEGDMSDEEMAYYLEVTGRVTLKISEIYQ